MHRCARAAWLLVMIVACDRSGADWERARTANTGEAYRQFLAQHPDSRHAADAQRAIEQLAAQAAAAVKAANGSKALARAMRFNTIPALRRVEREHAGTPAAQAARAAVETLLAERTPEVRGVRRVAVTLEAPPVLAAVPIAKRAGEILSLAGLEPASAGDPTDARLRIVVHARGLGRDYSRTGLGYDTVYRESGAGVSGSITFESGPAKVSRRFDGRIPPSDVVHLLRDGEVEPPPYFEAAGFSRAGDYQGTYSLRTDDVVDIDQTLAVQLIDLVRALFGPSVLRAAISEESNFRWSALAALDNVDDRATMDVLFALIPNPAEGQGLHWGLDGDSAMAAIGRSRDPQTLERVTPFLRQFETQTNALDIIERLGDRRAVPVLIDGLAAVPDGPLKSMTENQFVTVLQKLTGQKSGADVAAWRRWLDAQPKP